MTPPPPNNLGAYDAGKDYILDKGDEIGGDIGKGIIGPPPVYNTTTSNTNNSGTVNSIIRALQSLSTKSTTTATDDATTPAAQITSGIGGAITKTLNSVGAIFGVSGQTVALVGIAGTVLLFMTSPSSKRRGR